MTSSRNEHVLILAKTYPSPSAQYIETSCVAGVTSDGCMRRLYPVPFRLIEKDSQFKKWQWINVRVEKANKDRRPESHKIYVDTLQLGKRIVTSDGWFERRRWLDKLPTYSDFRAIEDARQVDQVSLALLKPARVLGLDIIEARHPDWTPEEREKLAREQMELLTEPEAQEEVRELRKVPYDFRYRYVCENAVGPVEYTHKIVDWEVGALYWNCRNRYGANWEAPFRAKLEAELIDKDLMFLMGNMHRFPQQWLIVSLIYPPRQSPAQSEQGQLF